MLWRTRQGGKELAVEDDVLMPLLLRCAAAEGLKIALHVEPYVSHAQPITIKAPD